MSSALLVLAVCSSASARADDAESVDSAAPPATTEAATPAGEPGAATPEAEAAATARDEAQATTHVASFAATRLKDSPAVVTVVSGEDIRTSGARDLIDILYLVPGYFMGLDTEGVVGPGFRGLWGHEGKILLMIDGKEIDFSAPYRRISMYDAIKEYTGIDIGSMDETQLRDVCHQLHIPVDNTMGKGKLIDELFSEKCEHHFIQPTFITDYPIEMSPLTKKHRSRPGLVERFELIANGKEIANAYSELNDPIDQRERFEAQLQLMERGDDEAMFIDYDFLRALEYGMPPTSGIGIGIDRLCMMMTNQASIQDVLLFPQMRPEQFGENEK